MKLTDSEYQVYSQSFPEKVHYLYCVGKDKRRSPGSTEGKGEFLMSFKVFLKKFVAFLIELG